METWECACTCLDGVLCVAYPGCLDRVCTCQLCESAQHSLVSELVKGVAGMAAGVGA